MNIMPFKINPIGADEFYWLGQKGYSHVPYLASSGTQFIDTGVEPSKNRVMQLDLEALPTTNVFAENGSSSSYTRFGICLYSNNVNLARYYVGWGNGFRTPSQDVPSINNRVVAELGPYYFKVNEIKVIDSTDWVWGDKPNTYPILLFTRNWVNAQGMRNNMDAACRQKLYRAKIGTQNSDGSVTWVRDLVPVRKIETGELMMLDICDPNNLTEYPNAGTGSFTTEE